MGAEATELGWLWGPGTERKGQRACTLQTTRSWASGGKQLPDADQVISLSTSLCFDLLGKADPGLVKHERTGETNQHPISG